MCSKDDSKWFKELGVPSCLQSLGQGCARGAELPKDLLAGRDGYLCSRCSRWDAALSKDPLSPSQHKETPQGAKSKGALQELDSEVVKNSCYLSILPLFLHSIAIAFFTRLFMEKVKLFWLGFRGIYGLSGVIKAQQEINPVQVIPWHRLVQSRAEILHSLPWTRIFV